MDLLTAQEGAREVCSRVFCVVVVVLYPNIHVVGIVVLAEVVVEWGVVGYTVAMVMIVDAKMVVVIGMAGNPWHED